LLFTDLESDLKLIPWLIGSTYLGASCVGQTDKELDDLPITIVFVEPINEETKARFLTSNFDLTSDKCFKALLELRVASWYGPDILPL